MNFQLFLCLFCGLSFLWFYEFLEVLFVLLWVVIDLFESFWVPVSEFDNWRDGGEGYKEVYEDYYTDYEVMVHPV